MHRLTRLAALLVAAVSLGCGEDPKPPPDIATLLPTDNEVSTWVGVDGKPQDVARTYAEIERIIDGAAEPYRNKVVAWAHREYVRGTDSTPHPGAQVWQLTDVTTAQSIYDSLASGTGAGTYSSLQFTDIALGDKARIADKGANDGWIINVRKGIFIIDVWMRPNNQTNRADIETFVKAILAKMN